METRWSRGKYGEVTQALKYSIVPDVGIVLVSVECKDFRVSSGQELKIYLLSNLQSPVYQLELHFDDRKINFSLTSANNIYTAEVL